VLNYVQDQGHHSLVSLHNHVCCVLHSVVCVVTIQVVVEVVAVVH
jgi:hypothetical protein